MSRRPLYRVNRITVCVGGKTSRGAIIERRAGRGWAMASVCGVDLVYRSRSTAERHCAWLNDPRGTEPAWGQDESPNARRERTRSTNLYRHGAVSCCLCAALSGQDGRGAYEVADAMLAVRNGGAK